LWQNTNGDVSNWLGTQSGGWIINDAAAYVEGVDPTWYVLGTGDFNDDGRDDLIWASEDIPGRQIWFAESDGGYGAPVPVGSWGTAWLQWHWSTHIGDFNGDGRHDLFFTNNGSSFQTSLATPGQSSIDVAVTPTASIQWQVAGVGDFNDDGFDDVLWRNATTGAVSNWLSTGTGDFIVNDAVAYHLVSTSWHVEQVGDFNGDGNADIFWRNDNGVVSDWLGTNAGGFVINDANAWTPVSLEWGVRVPLSSGAGDWDY
jgi:hypothetical protein